jgi:hypothetical protein
MEYFDYKVVPAPRQCRKSKGVSDPAELFALTLGDLINEHAREGWEYVRSEVLSAEIPRGFFRRSTEETMPLLIFRRAREDREPRLQANATPPASGQAPERHLAPVAARAGTSPAASPHVPSQRAEPTVTSSRTFEERVHAASIQRREPRVPDQASGQGRGAPSPLRPTPRIGPIDPG